jgi:hypothetical protein
MSNKPKDARRERALLRLQVQLKNGVKNIRDKDGKPSQVTLTDADIKRIQKEIATLKNPRKK